MALPPHDELRNRRDRAFQARLLLALEKPASSRFWSVINSSALLWLATALLIVGLGACFTQYQQCIRDAEKIVDTYPKLADELRFRRSQVFDIIQQSKTKAEAEKRLKSVAPRDFRDRSLFSLTRELERLSDRVDPAVADESISYMLPLTDSLRPTGTGIEHHDYYSILWGVIPDDLEEEDFETLKGEVKVLRDAMNNDREHLKYSTLHHSCTPEAVYRVYFRGWAGKIVTGNPPLAFTPEAESETPLSTPRSPSPLRGPR